MRDSRECAPSLADISRPFSSFAKKKKKKNEDPEQVREDPCHSDLLEWMQEFSENLVDDRVLERRDSHASSSHGSSSELVRSVDLGKHSICTHFPKTEIARSVRGPKLQGPRAADVLAEPYFVQKMLVI